jgi:hypothetical protein
MLAEQIGRELFVVCFHVASVEREEPPGTNDLHRVGCLQRADASRNVSGSPDKELHKRRILVLVKVKKRLETIAVASLNAA